MLKKNTQLKKTEQWGSEATRSNNIVTSRVHSPRGRMGVEQNAAFTLAEVLITLVIIGVVAAMTIPALINKYKEKQYITAFKKMYNELSQVTQQLNIEYGGYWYNNECANYDNICFRNLFANKMRILKQCNNPISEGCFKESTYLDKSSIPFDDGYRLLPSIILTNGTSIMFRLHRNGCVADNTNDNNDVNKNLSLNCGWVYVDVNGIKKPNVMGKDIFQLKFFKDGTIKGNLNVYGTSEYDTSFNKQTIENECKHGKGLTCSALYLMK